MCNSNLNHDVKEKMKALIGLGNPEVKYKYTRHNTGFLMMDAILKAHNVTLGDKFNSFFAKSGDILYLLPKTYMNLSGDAVIELMNFYKLTNKDVLVIYDDATIEFGMFRLRKDGSLEPADIKKLNPEILDQFQQHPIRIGDPESYSWIFN